MTIAYDAGDLSGWVGLPKLFLRYRGTILAGTLTSPLFLLSNVLHVGFLFLGGRLEVGSMKSNASNPDQQTWEPMWESYNLIKVRRASNTEEMCQRCTRARATQSVCMSA